VSEENLPTWQEAAATGTVEELLRWAEQDHHVDLANRELVLTLAANAITNGAWRNNSEIEDIHAGGYKRPGMKKPRGLRDAEMMVASIETSRLVRAVLAADDDEFWSIDAADAITDPDRPLAGTPLSEHVTKKVLRENRKQVDTNLARIHGIYDLVGRERFLLGAALCALAYCHYGTPMWSSTIDSWTEETGSWLKDGTEPPSAAVIEAIREDPTTVQLDVLQEALGTGLWGAARGRRRWHQDQCGDGRHRPSEELRSFLGIMHSITGVPLQWQYAAAVRATELAAQRP
jgi:hypothetical protein